MNCELCQQKEISETPAKIVLEDGEIKICDECELLLVTIEERVNREQSI
jgi:ribosome-binding protein aMBF1 (putative translation factor)